MADTKDLLQFLERGVRLVANLGLKFGRIKLAPTAPTGLGGQRVCFGGCQIAINRAFAQPKEPGGPGPRPAPGHILHHPLAQIQRVGFHGPQPITYTANVNVNCYSLSFGRRLTRLFGFASFRFSCAMKTALNQHVLVLNRLWQAVNVCTARRALTLLFQGQAQVVMEATDGSFRTFNFQEWRDVATDAPHDECIHAISFRIRVPRIILLFMYDRMPKKEVKFTRHNIFAVSYTHLTLPTIYSV